MAKGAAAAAAVAAAERRGEKTGRWSAVQGLLGADHRPRHGTRRRLAEVLGVTTRQLYNRLKAEERGDAPKKPGPKPPTEAQRAEVEKQVKAVLDEKGWTLGEGKIRKALLARGKEVSLTDIRKVLKPLREEKNARRREAKAARRVTIVCCATDAVWAQDATELGRDAEGKVSTEVVREVTSGAIGGVLPRLGDSKAQDAVAAFEAMAEQRGCYPLVAADDNGAPYVSAEYQKHLEDNQVVQLRNLPRTPQHNAFAERCVREIKDEAVWVDVPADIEADSLLAVWTFCLSVALRRLKQRPRSTMVGVGTTEELDKSHPKAYALVDRATFYAAAKEAMAAARQAHQSARARRLAERMAILRVLCMFGLIEVYRGGVKLDPCQIGN